MTTRPLRNPLQSRADPVRLFDGVGRELDGEAGFFGNSPGRAALVEAHAHVAAAFLEVEGMGMALAAIAQNRDLFPLE